MSYEFGKMLRHERERHRLSIRAAARAAYISEGLWRQLEKGGRNVHGHWIPANPSTATLQGIVLALPRTNPQEIFSMAGKEYDPRSASRPTESAGYMSEDAVSDLPALREVATWVRDLEPDDYRELVDFLQYLRSRRRRPTVVPRMSMREALDDPAVADRGRERGPSGYGLAAASGDVDPDSDDADRLQSVLDDIEDEQAGGGGRE